MTAGSVPPQRWYDEPALTWMDLIGDGIDFADVMAPERPFNFRAIADTPTQLIDEFRNAPFGPYSSALQELLCVLRTQDRGGRHLLLRQPGNNGWIVARVAGRGQPVERVLDHVFTSRAAAEWAVFALRWREHTGRFLDPMELTR